jgi:hypothetical protein
MREAGFEPMEPYPGQQKPWRCTCTTCDHEVTLYLSNIIAGQGCRWCSRKAVDPDAAAELMRAAGLEPLEKYPPGSRPWRCRCNTCGREVTPTYGSVRSGSGCKYCSGSAVDVETVMAAMAEAGFEPLEAYPGVNVPWHCRCITCGRGITPRYTSIRGGHGCAFCARKAVDADEAVKIMLAASLRPLEPYPGAGAPWRCECTKCARVVLPRWSNIKSGWGGCGWCSEHRVDPELAAAAARVAGLDPLEPYPGSARPWKCRCLTCQRVVATTWSAIRGGSSCRYCADHGFWSGDGPALVYLISHKEYGAIKIGVTRERTVRLQDHLRHGWEVMNVWRGLQPELAFQAEQAVLRMWRSEGIPDAVARGLMPNRGHSETASLDLVDLARTRSLVVRMLAVDPAAMS